MLLSLVAAEVAPRDVCGLVPLPSFELRLLAAHGGASPVLLDGYGARDGGAEEFARAVWSFMLASMSSLRGITC